MEGLLLLDYLGVFAFAAFGAYLAIRKAYDIFGVIAVAFISALGGGTLREMLLGDFPLYLIRYQYWLIVLAGAAFAVIFFKRFRSIQNWMLGIDAVGLVTFAFLGAARAHEEGFGISAALFFAVVTAVGGGILRDVVMRETPLIFYEDLYATIALFVGAAYALLRTFMDDSISVYTLLLVAFLFRLAAIRFKIRLWKPQP